MKEKKLKISLKSYDTVKELTDKDLGSLTRALCEYVFYGKTEEPKDKVVQVYFKMFKEKIDTENFYRESGRLGGIKSNALKQKEEEMREDDIQAVVFDIFKVDTIGELFKSLLTEQKKNPICGETRASKN